MSTPGALGPRRTGLRLVGHLARRALVLEVRGYQSLYRFLFRRPRVPAGARAFSHHGPVLAVLVVLVAVSAVELVAVDLVVRRWPGVRVALLVLGIWGLVFMLGLLLGLLTRPHAVGPEGLRIRSGTDTEVSVAWASVDAVARKQRRTQDRQPSVTVDDGGRVTLHLRVQDETNLELHLVEPTELRLPRGRTTVDVVAFYADDPRGFLDEVRRHLG